MSLNDFVRAALVDLKVTSGMSLRDIGITVRRSHEWVQRRMIGETAMTLDDVIKLAGAMTGDDAAEHWLLEQLKAYDHQRYQ